MKLLALALLVGCGTVAAPGPDASSDTDAASDATIDDGVDVALDAPDAASEPLVDAGIFLCVDCLCDGRTSYCRGFIKGNAPMTDAGVPDAAMCAMDAGLTGCVAYPSTCAQAPTCACLVANQPQPACGCTEDEGGAGFDVSCYLP